MSYKQSEPMFLNLAKCTAAQHIHQEKMFPTVCTNLFQMQLASKLCMLFLYSLSS